MGLICSFVVVGVAVPQGSTTTWNKRDPRTGDFKPAITHARRDSLMLWRHAIRSAIQQQVAPAQLVEGPVAVRAIFHITKPASVAKKRVFPTVAPDLDKTCRALGDALEKVLVRNDAQVVHWSAWKVYTAGPSKLVVEIWEPDALVVPVGNPFDTQPRLFLAEQSAPEADEEPFSETLGDA
jgi:Holliday junction resolvase RusA-like endonuclease